MRALILLPLNLPNLLTLLRIVAVPIVVVAVLDETPDGNTLAAVVFALAAFTDLIDGALARSRGDVTTFGKLMDPLADKLLITAALVSLVALDRVAAWVAIVIIAREFAVTGLRALAMEEGVVIAASWLGKLKTLLQVAMIFVLIATDTSPVWVQMLINVTVVVTIASALDYFFGAYRRVLAAREARGEVVRAHPGESRGGSLAGRGVKGRGPTGERRAVPQVGRDA